MADLSSPNPVQQGSSSKAGCESVIILVLAVFWVLAACVIALTTSYGVEQLLVEGSLRIPDTRWIIALGFSFALLIPLGIWFWQSRQPRTRAVARTWFLAAVFSALFIPGRFVNLMDADLTSILQIAALSIFALGLSLWRMRAGSSLNARPSAGSAAIGIAFALLLAIPWVLWGAAGSPLDIVLALMVGLLFGLNAALLLETSLLDGSKTSGSGMMDGFVFAITLLVMVTGMGQNNEQWLLAAVIPALAWAAMYISRSSQSSGASAWLPVALLLGLAAAWPLLWLDPDELAVVVASGPGEISSWATKMTSVSFGIGVLLSILTARLSVRLIAPAGRRISLLLAVLLLIGLASLHFTSNRSGFYGERLFVILKDQADLSAAAPVGDYQQRRLLVYQTLIQHAQTTQADLRNQLSRFGVEYKPYYLVNGLEVTGGPLLRLWLQSRPEVDRILSNPILRPLPKKPETARGSMTAPTQPEWNLTLIHADQVWKEQDVRGQGVVIGQSDSGAQGDHPELAGTYRGKNGSNDYNWLDPWYGSESPVDIGGHGTHTLGSIVGKTVGVAPEATWIGCVNLARNLGNPANYLDCMQFLLAPYPQHGDAFRDGNPLMGAMVLNNSWGCPEIEGCDPNALLPAVKALRTAGVFVVVSAGNSGYTGCATVTDPLSLYGEVYTVGAINSSGNLADFSSKGPVTVDGSGRIKPNIVAPGEGVLSAFPNNTYQIEGGTSMAGPHVVGVVALMWSANPKLIGDIDRTTQILDQTAQPAQGNLPECAGNGKPNNGVGYGIVDAYQAVKMAIAAR